MGCQQPVRLRSAEDRADHVSAFLSDGYAIIRGLFSADEVAAIAAAADQVHAEGMAYGRSFRHGNLFYDVASPTGSEPVVRMVQWPSYHQPVLDSVRLDRRIASAVEPLIGATTKQIINQLHWKSRGRGGDFAWHQDCRSRRPAWAYRNLAGSYVQTGLAIDPHGPLSGGLRFIPGSHLNGDLAMDCSKRSLGTPLRDKALGDVGLSGADAIDLELEPGDLALWSAYIVHGSGENRSDHQRRFYINGYVRAQDCDRGEWAFRDGEPVPLGPVPALVHYEELRERPGPHYV